MNKLLCATDLSEASDEALRQADQQCTTGTRLTVLHVEPPLVPTSFAGYGLPALSPGEIEGMRARAREALEAQVKRVALRCPQVDLEIAPATGPAYAEVVRRAEAGNFDLVVVGSHGAGGLERVLMGSVADKVVRYCHAPVLVARRPPGSGDVLVATDISDGSRQALLAGAREAARRKRNLTVAHCLGFPAELMGFGYAPLIPAPPPLPESRVAQKQAAEERLQRLLAENRIEARIVIDEGDAVAGIVGLAESLPAELIVVGASGKTGLARVLLGSVATAVVHKAPCPVLVTRPPSESAPASKR
jgi:nucleotide-binding universal stress UspA family protein